MSLLNTGSIWFKVAGLVGASGVAMAAYGAHGFKPADAHFAEVYRRANQQQMYHAGDPRSHVAETYVHCMNSDHTAVLSVLGFSVLVFVMQRSRPVDHGVYCLACIAHAQQPHNGVGHAVTTVGNLGNSLIDMLSPLCVTPAAASALPYSAVGSCTNDKVSCTIKLAPFPGLQWC